MSEKKNIVVAEEAREDVVNATSEANTEKVIGTYDEIIARLKGDSDNKFYRGLIVRNVTVNQDDYPVPLVTLVVNGLVNGWTEEGITTTHNVRVSVYALAGVMKENEDAAVLANSLLRNPQLAEALFSRAVIDVIQVPVKAGEEYHNPFSTRDDSASEPVNHDWYATHIVSIKLGKAGERLLDKYFDSLL